MKLRDAYVQAMKEYHGAQQAVARERGESRVPDDVNRVLFRSDPEYQKQVMNEYYRGKFAPDATPKQRRESMYFESVVLPRWQRGD